MAASRTLNIGKYDWVQRNNRLVLQYRQLAPISLRLPPSDQLVGFPEEKIPLAATVEARFGFKAINWNSEALTAAGGTIKHLGDTRYEVILPKKPGRYPLIGIAVDQQGNQSTAATTEITVKQLITLTLPRQLFGGPEETLPLEVQVEAHFGFKEITWDDHVLTEAGGAVKTLEDGRYQITSPKAPGSYLLTGIAVDKQGNKSSAATTELVVSDVVLKLPPQVHGTPDGTADLPIEVFASNGFKEIRWEAAEFKKDGGALFATPGEEHEHWSLDLPNQEKTYIITGIAVDKAGNHSRPATVQVIVKKELSAVKIEGPETKELPATWLSGETIELTASGGDGTYAWTTSDDTVASIDDKKDGHCIVTIKKTGAATIKVTSAGDTASYTELEAEQPLLQAMDNTLRNYLESEAYCKDKGGSLPNDQILKDILQVRLKEVESWARKTFEPVENKKFISWVKDEEPGKEGEGNWKRPGYDLATGKPYIQLEGAQELCTICQFNP
ncbi:Ig-like domain-containing protein [unidentified bacterial endosymbiont]|uniref:Ig-like domain-containing protein n=1 Tax=unidentified bacterial endosymbiont TaxID=2355 RepID=UPI0020A196D8|nr:hypothetical protein [unidentified bacterial endosymbiont]